MFIYKDATEFFKREEDDLHDYLAETFVLDEQGTFDIIKQEVRKSMEVDFEIENFLSQQEFDAEYFTGWGEDSHSTLDDIVFVDSSKDTENGYISIFGYLEYDVDFTISTKNPLYDRDDDDPEYLREDGANTRIQIGFNATMLNNEITDFTLEEIDYI
ncbi:hypothetical protein [Niallia circulans]|uniref:hypothetical protein n=1 Tax=Niallia circulans TaxID=1397 RepID=UPI00352439BA